MYPPQMVDNTLTPIDPFSLAVGMIFGGAIVAWLCFGVIYRRDS